MASDYEDEEDYYLPPEHQRPFTSGIRRKRVPFVRASDLETTAPTPSTSSGASIADKYLSIVMKTNTTPSTPTQASPAPTRTHSAPPETSPDICEICNLPLSNPQHPQPHEASLAHQVCLTHSHPPSHLDRTRTGLRYLSSYGWNPDARVGLGASGEGIREPIKPRPKYDTAGLGTGVDKDGDVVKKVLPVKVKKELLNAKQVRRKVEADRKRGERLRKAFNQNDEVLKYLGEDM